MFKLTPNATALFTVEVVEGTNQINITFAYKQREVLAAIRELPMVYDFSSVYTYDADEELTSNPEKEFSLRVNKMWDTAAIAEYLTKHLQAHFEAKAEKDAAKEAVKAAEEALEAAREAAYGN